MADMLIAAVLGVVQGLTEFLPISSSGHLVLVPWMLNVSDPGLTFDVALHLGTFLALVFLFWRSWRDIFVATWRKQTVGEWSPQVLWWIVLASLPAAVLGVVLEDAAANTLRHPLVVAGTLFVVGLVLWFADARSGKKTISAVSLGSAFVIGCAQATALVPGVSRSGATMIAALFLGFARTEAARFSFVLAMPITLGAGIFALRDISRADLTPAFFVGVAVAALTGAWVIRFLLRYLSRNTFRPFVWYRVALAGAVVVLYLSRM